MGSDVMDRLLSELRLAPNSQACSLDCKAGGRLTFSFGDQMSACRTAYKVPADTWLEVAWIYDASNEEQRIWMNGEEMKACSGAAPFRGFGQQVVAGELQSAKSRLRRLTSLFVFPEALETKDIAAIFSQVPLTSSAALSGHAGATKVGPASQLGIDGGSFTITMQLLKTEADGVIISGVKDSDSSPPGLLLATRDGSLQSVVLDQICQAESPLPSGRWVQVALVFDAQHGLQRLFQDGKLAKMCQVSRLPATRLGNVDLWLGRGNVDQNGWLGQMKDLQVFSHSECAVNLQELAGGIRPKERERPWTVDLSDFEESFNSLDADRNGRISADEYMNGLGAVSLSVAAKKHPQGDLLPAPVPSSQLGVPKLQAPKVTPSPRQASPTQHPAENLWVPGPASASNIMLGTAGEDDQSPPATPKPLQQVQSPSAALPLSPLNRDPPQAPFNPFLSASSPLPASSTQVTTTNFPQPPTTPEAPPNLLATPTQPPPLSTAKASRPSAADNPLNQEPPAAPFNPFAMLTTAAPRRTTKAFLAPTAAPVAIPTTATTEIPESTALRESSTSSFLAPAQGQDTVIPTVTFPPSFKPVKLGIPGGLSVDPLDMHPAALPSEHESVSPSTASTTASSTASTTVASNGIDLGSMFKPFGMFEDRELHLHTSKWRHLIFLSMAAMAISASSFSVVLWLRRMRSQRDAWDTFAVGGEMVRLVS
eukprot:s1227_g12.t1